MIGAGDIEVFLA